MDEVGTALLRGPAGQETFSSHLYPNVLFFELVVYASCLFSTFANERYSRTLFTIHNTLSQQRDALLTERDRLRWVVLVA
jgi:hypothetical protein